MTNFWGDKKKLELKKPYIKKKSSSVSARKLKCLSSARLGSESSQLGLARARKFQLEPISKSYIAQIYYYDLQSAGIKVQSTQKATTPRRLTLVNPQGVKMDAKYKFSVCHCTTRFYKQSTDKDQYSV